MEESVYLKIRIFLSDYKNCNKCPELYKNRTQVVFPTFNVLKRDDFSGVMFIGEAPGFNEDKLGIPFVGKSGNELDKLLNRIGLMRNQVYITNTLLCRPPDNRNPNKNELENCKPRLSFEIKTIKPKIIVTLGNFATKYVFSISNMPEMSKRGITSLRGKVFDVVIFDTEIKLIPMLHPATILYSGGNKINIFYEDFDLLKGLL